MTTPPEIIITAEDIAEAYRRISTYRGTHLLAAELVIYGAHVLAGARAYQVGAA